MTASVVVDFSKEPEFPKTPGGEPSRVELVREQVRAYIEGYTAAKRRHPERIVLAASDYRHCVRRFLARMQRPRLHKAKEEWQAARKAGSTVLWRDARPLPLTEADLTWSGIPIEKSAGYSRHRPVDRAAA